MLKFSKQKFTPPLPNRDGYSRIARSLHLPVQNILCKLPAIFAVIVLLTHIALTAIFNLINVSAFSVFSVTPNTGPLAGGNLITISGSGFDIPTPQPIDFSSGGTYTATYPGKYKLEVWGAQGGGSGTNGGRGAYATGIITLNRNDALSVVVGSRGSIKTGTGPGYTGGGITYISLGSTRMVIGGAGGGQGGNGWSDWGGTSTGANGGVGTGITTVANAGNGNGGQCAGGGGGGTQTAGGTGGTANANTISQGTAGTINSNTGQGGNGGAGYYGGGGGASGCYYPTSGSMTQSGNSGGSGSLNNGGTGGGASSPTLRNATGGAGGGGGSSYADPNLESRSGVAGSGVMPDPASTTGGTMTGRAGNGYARITPMVTVDVQMGIDPISQCTDVTIVNPTTITCIAPAHSSGYVNVHVTINGERTTLIRGYRYFDPPTVTSVTPNTGPTAGGTNVTITGTNFAMSNVSIVQAATGQYISLARDNKGNLYSWGSNASGALGVGTTTGPETCGAYSCSMSPIKISDGAIPSSPLTAGINITQIAVGYESAYALDDQGNLYAWGLNNLGQLGTGNTTSSSLPIKISSGVIPGSALTAGINIVKITASSYNTYAIDDQGNLYAWGSNDSGQLGIGTTSGPNTCTVTPSSYSCSTLPIKISDGAILSSPFIAGVNITQVAYSSANSYGQAFALDDQGNLYAFGDNRSGHLGDGTTITRALPFQISGGVVASSALTAGINIIKIQSSSTFASALDDQGNLYTWGTNAAGQLGNGTTGGSSMLPIKISGGTIISSPLTAGVKIVQVATGSQHQLAIDDQGVLYAWGQGGNGQLGNNDTSTNSSLPIQISDGAIVGSPLTSNINIDQATAGYYQSLIIDDQGNVYAMGINGRGQLGIGSTTNAALPTFVNSGAFTPIPPVVTFGGAPCINVAVVSDTEITCTTTTHIRGYVDVSVMIEGHTATLSMGYRYLDPHTVTSVTPNFGPDTGGTDVTISGTNFEQDFEWKQISAGFEHTCAISFEDKAYCWGSNWSGQFGDSTSLNERLIPTAISAGNTGLLDGKTVKQISTSNEHTCAIASDDTAYCWGGNGDGQLGDNSYTGHLVPTRISAGNTGLLDGKTVKQISTEGYRTCAIASDDTAYCWGTNTSGGIGDGTSVTNRPVPTAISAGNTGLLDGKTVKYISTGSHTCAIASDDTAYCWGDNHSGEIGDNTSGTSRLVPTAISAGNTGLLDGKTVKQISAGVMHTCAIASDDTAYCWGHNGQGQLGDNTITQRLIPTAISAGNTGLLDGKTVKHISAGANSVCAIASDGTTYCWGYNGNGELGDNTQTDRRIPTLISAGNTGLLDGKTVKQISVGYQHACAIADNNHSYCWGGNWEGRLGDGTDDERLIPTSVDVSDLVLPIITFDPTGTPTLCTDVVVVSSTQIT
ncbi:IPT/TIG domain-containing protein, partial [Candidatus Saccharibacteria bacterium]|nr:IPT/TIG domain-containing protein [Candidatus Saccharibacteria bacterium]